MAYVLLIIVLGIIAWRPKWGGWLVLALLPSYLIRFNFFSIPTTLLELMIYGWLLITLLTLIKKKQLRKSAIYLHTKFKDFYIGILIFLLGATISVFIADDLRLAAGSWKAWIVDPLIFSVLFLHYYRQADLKKIFLALSGTMWLVSLWGLVEYLGKFGMQIPGYLNAMYQSANMVAILLVPIWFLLFVYFLSLIYPDPKVLIKKYFYWVITLLVGVIVIYLTRSLAGLVAWFISIFLLAVWLPVKSKKIKRIFIISMVGVFVIALLGFWQQGKLQRFFNGSQYNSLQTRQQIWQVSGELIRQNPMLGIGFGSFEKHYYRQAFEMFDPPLEWEVPKAHNLYLNTYLETGLLGLVGFFYMLVVFFQKAIQNISKQIENINDYFINLGLVIAMLSILIHGLLDTPYFKNDLSIVFWLVFIMIILVSGNKVSQKQNNSS